MTTHISKDANKESPRYRIKLSDKTNQKVNHLVRWWLLKILVDLGAYREWRRSGIAFHDKLSAFLGIYWTGDTDNKEITSSELLKALKQLKSQIKQKTRALPSTLSNNIKTLACAVDLNHCEQQILVFITLTNEYPQIEDVTDELGQMGPQRCCQTLAEILGLPKARVHQALSFSGTLHQAGLLTMGSASGCFVDSFNLLEGLSQNLFQPQPDIKSLLSCYFMPSPKAELTLGQYPHIQGEIELLHAHLSAKREPGINILIHGLPGVGKTQLVRALAKSLRQNLYEIGATDAAMDPASGDARFSMYRLAQQLLKRNKRSVILFDEVEDVFPPPYHWFFKPEMKEKRHKAWLHQLLENNPVPAFWLTNSTDGIDHATLRRFDVVIELKGLTTQQKEKLFTDSLRNTSVSTQWIQQQSQRQALLPAHITRATNVIQRLPSRTPEKTEKILSILIDNTLQAMGEYAAPAIANPVGLTYQLDYVNTYQDISMIINGLNRTGSGRLCLYGPPGTGKTQLAHHVAKLLDRPIMRKTASEIISAYIGETEKNIAKMFREARDEQSVLLLDEADGFLRDRRGASHSWELTQVNELLVQMESYEGIFIASTNLIEELDQASARRFDLKIEFDYLKPDQVWRLFQETLTILKIKLDSSDKKIEDKVKRLTHLTPGDAVTVLRQHRITQAITSTGKLIEALREEIEAKQINNCKPMGFLVNL